MAAPRKKTTTTTKKKPAPRKKRSVGADIETAVKEVIKGLRYPIDVEFTDDDALKSTMASKETAFTVAKDLITKWRHSHSAPTFRILEANIKDLVDAGETAIVNLQEALRKEIDYESLKPTAHKAAIEAKPLIYSALFNVNAGVIELKRQLDTGKINTQDEEFELGFPEKFANGEIMDVPSLFKDWYNDKEDAVKICPHGTEGKIIEIEGLKIQLPNPPEDIEEILFIDYPKEEQYWRRPEVPAGISRETANEYIEFIHQEFKRRVEGVWFMNNGVPTYLTGDMYFALTYGKMLDDGGYMNYREPQRDLFYFLQACIVDKRCLGDLFEKSRRTGFTYVVLFIVLNRITMMKNQKAGITSKTDKDAEEAFLKFSYAFLSLPFFFRPVVKGRAESNKRLEFAKPPDLTRDAQKKANIAIDKYLNSFIDYRASVDGSYDSIQLNWYICDEAGKRHNGHSIIKHLGQVTPTMKKGGRIVGKAFVGSTVGEADKGGDNFKKVADGSECTERDKVTGRTSTNLYRHALYAHENHEMHIDRYGKCHQVKPEVKTYNIFGELIMNGSMEYIKAEADAARRQSDELFNEYLRANPMTRGDMYRPKGGGNNFNLVKINEQHIYNNNLPDDYVMRGYFTWLNNEPDTEVIWNPDRKGKFRVTWLPKQENRNQIHIEGGVKFPKNGSIGRGGVDSFDIDKTVDDRHSDGAISFYNMFSQKIDMPSNQFVLEYCERPPYREVFYEDYLMASVFYGYPSLIENNKREIIEYTKKRGYGGYVMKRPREYTPEVNIKKKVVEWGIPSNSKDIILRHESAIQRYIHYHVGEWTEQNEAVEVENGRTGYRDVGATGSMLLTRTLEDWAKFDPAKRTKYDLSISSGYALLAADVKIRTYEDSGDVNEREARNKTRRGLVRRYKYVNGVPQRI